MTQADYSIHPPKILVTIEQGRAWGQDCAIYQEKLDGNFETVAMGGDVLAGESVINTDAREAWRGKRRFVVWDCLAINGRDIRQQPASVRWNAARDLAAKYALPVVQWSPNGGELLARVLAAGGEGVVRKDAGATYFDAMQACKRGGIWLCKVVGHCGGTQSVFIADAETGADRGKLTLRGGRCDQVRAGSLIRVEGMNLTEAGKIRQPQPAREWLIQF